MTASGTTAPAAEVDRATARAGRRLRAVAAVSMVYDVGLGLALWLGRSWLAEVVGVPAPVPPIHADLNALFTITVGIGYALPLRDPWRHRGYLWLMGPWLKGAGATWFVADHLLRQSPAALLAFAVSDGLLALVTLWALLVSRRRPASDA